MKLRMFATAAVVAAAAVAAPAFAQTVGSVGVSAAHTEVEDFDGQTYAIDGNVALKASENWTVTLNGSAATFDGDLGDDSAFSGGVAATYAGSDWRVGPFIQGSDAGDTTLWAGGVVGQKYLDNVTLSGAVTYGQIDDVDADIWAINGDVRYFINDNFRINGGLGFAKIDANVADADMWTAGVGAEYQFASSPWSVFGGYDHVEVSDLDVSADTFKIGARYSFGGDLKARDRAGADLPNVTSAFTAGLF